MPRLTIDGHSVDAPEGATVLEAAAQVGIEIPALCHVQGVRPLTSCMLCVVKETHSGRTFPSCSAKAKEGMAIQTNNEDIRAARRDTLQLLLSEHAGDCIEPCRRICPASLNVSRLMRLTAEGRLEAAARLAKETLVLPMTLGCVCSAPCERGCHRASYDEPLMIRETHRRLAEQALKDVDDSKNATDTGKRVAIVGAGAAGLSAAWVLRRRGHTCRVFERQELVGGPLLSLLKDDELPREVFEQEVASVKRLGVELETNCAIGKDRTIQDLLAQFDAVLVACDDLECDDDRVFMAVEYPMTVNAVAEGKRAANRIDTFLRGTADEIEKKRFDCRLGALDEGDKGNFVVGRVEPDSVPRERCADDVRAEAKRCLHCECLKPVSCKLRKYADEYGADQYAYRGDGRPSVEAQQHAGSIAYEPGKCIRCGLCVEITTRAAEPFGLAFVGRGFGARVAVPFGRTLTEGLVKTARECVEACPTGALVYRQGEGPAQ